MPSLSRRIMPLRLLRKRCATSFFSCNPLTEGCFSRDARGANSIKPICVEPDRDAPPTKADYSYIEVKEQEPQPLVTPTYAALPSSGSSDGTPHGSGPLELTRTTRASTKRFERPNYQHILAHAICCCFAYPIIYAGTVAAKDKSLFWARVIVGLWCAGVGVVIGWSLVAFATKFTEAASEHFLTFLFFFAPRGYPSSVLTDFF